ncbi:protease Lon-related BREX system protein BrxL [bacterium]|nr:protease Lon-related BREX system protein BrxL [bacterium]MBU4511272.1 protease Lon-related BREX system protein BrxL [bacterium]
MSIILDDLDKKLIDNFRGFVVKKDLVRQLKLGANVPVFVLEYLLANSCSTFDEEQMKKGISNVKNILQDHYINPKEGNLIQSKIREKGKYTIIDKIEVTLDVNKDRYWARLLNSNIKEANISDALVVAHEKLLLGGIWAIMDIEYDPEIKIGNKSYPFIIRNIKPIQLASFDLSQFIEKRKKFTKDEWIDVLVRSIGIEPSSESVDKRMKMLLISRLIPLIEANFNLIELGPRMTGKSYVYKEITPYAILLSGGQTTVAQLFINNTTRKIGLVGNWDTVAFDEVAGIHFKDKDGIAILKDYMESGSFSRGSTGEMTGGASIVFNGNINQSVETLLKTSHLFSPLPDDIRNDTAFLDRLHFYLPGWDVVKLSPNNFTNNFGFSMDYFSEIFTHMRRKTYADVIEDYFALGTHLRQRDSKAVKKTVSGFIKLLNPDGNFTKEDVREYLVVALEMRRRVKEQLKRIGGMEFWDTNFSYIDKDSREEVFVSVPEERGSSLIENQPLQPGLCYTVSQSIEGMSLIRIEASVILGNGKINISGTNKPEIRDNIKNVYQYIKANEKNILSQEHSLSNYNISIQLSNLIGNAMSNAIGAAVYTTILSAIHKRCLKAGIALLGDISINGAITRVDNFSDKVAMLSENGAKLVLTPMDNLKEIENIPPSILNNTDINFYSNTQMIIQKAISNE